MKKILIVEDHPEVREPLVRLLRHEGYEATPAANGAEALTSMGAHVPDLLLLDLMLPKVDGLKVLETLRRDARFAELPVIVLTGLEGSALAQARALGASVIIQKSKFSVDELLGRIRRSLADEVIPKLENAASRLSREI